MSRAIERPRARTGRRIGSACSALAAAVLVGLLAFVLGASPASAYWTATGEGAATGRTETLGPPTDVTVPAEAVTDVPLSWTVGTGGVAPTGYYVTRDLGAITAPACSSSPAALRVGTSCLDAGVPDGDYTYVVTAVFRTWTAPSAESSTVSAVNPTHLAFLSQPTDVTGGDVIAPPVVVTLLTAAGTAAAYAGMPITLAIGTNPGGGTLAGTTTVLSAADGTATFNNLAVDRPGVGYTLVASSPDLTPATSLAFTVLLPPPLVEASSYSVLGGAGVVNTLPTTISGDLGTGPGFVATGFPPGTVGGDIHVGDADAANALGDFVDAYDELRVLTPATALPGEVGGLTLGPGVYRSGAAVAVTGILTLNGGGDPDARFVFQVGAALNMAADGQIVLINGAQAANVYWVITGAVTIGARSQFKGTILADGAITIGDSSELIGRAFATGAVTMANNTIRFTTALPPVLTMAGGIAVVTKDTTPAISGTSNAPAGTTIKVTVDGQLLTTTVQSGGGWTVTAGPLLAGSYPLVAQVRDAAGNGTKVTQTLTVEVNPDPVALGLAGSFSVLSATAVVNTGTSHLSGDLGVSVGVATGFPPGTLGGAIHAGDAAASSAQADLLAAIDDAEGRRAHTEFAGNLGGRTFHAGVHHAAAAVGLTGIVTLDGENDPNAVFIFQIGAALTAAASCQVNLINGVQAANVFWVVNGAAGTGASCVFGGNILVRGAITLGASTNLVGRALSRDAVTLASNAVTGATPAPAARFSGSARSDESDDPTSVDPTPTPTRAAVGPGGEQ